MHDVQKGIDEKAMIRQALALKNISNAALSRQMGKTDIYTTSMLNKPSRPTLDTLQAIADALEMRLEIALVDDKTGKRIDA